MPKLDSELLQYRSMGTFGPMIRHPLVYAVPFIETDEMVVLLNKMLQQKKEQAEAALSDHKYLQYLMLHERPWRLVAFRFIEEELCDKMFWELLGDVWIDCENVYEFCMDWWELLTHHRAHREYFMRPTDREAFKKLPDVLTVYRGTTEAERDGHYIGYSWTLDNDKAKWFATRFAKDGEGRPVIATAIVRKADIVGYLNGRGEEEVIATNGALGEVSWEVV